MEEIVLAIKSNKNYAEIKKLYSLWEEDSKALLVTDMAIVHKNKDALRFICDHEGSDIFYTPYDDHDRITPHYMAEMLCTINQDYFEIRDFIKL